MKKNKIIIWAVLAMLIVVISNIVMANNDTNESKKNKQNESVTNSLDNIELIRKAYYPEFTKENKIFISEVVEVSKEKYTGNMFIILSGENMDGKFQIKVFDDENIIYSGAFDSTGIVIPYKMSKEKGNFRIEVTCTANLEGDQKIVPPVVWFANKHP